MGRATQGVRLINLRTNDEIASIAKVPASEEEEEIEGLEGVVEGSSGDLEGAENNENQTSSEEDGVEE
jgi:DNA gyrase subunit A